MLTEVWNDYKHTVPGSLQGILHPDRPPNFTKLVQSAVKFRTKDIVLGGVIADLSIRPDAQENLGQQPKLQALSESRSSLFYKEPHQVLPAEC